MTRGKYTRDFYLIPTILYHNGDGIYASLELAWLKWYIGFCWMMKKDDKKPFDIAIKALEQENEAMQKTLDIIKTYEESNTTE